MNMSIGEGKSNNLDSLYIEQDDEEKEEDILILNDHLIKQREYGNKMNESTKNLEDIPRQLQNLNANVSVDLLFMRRFIHLLSLLKPFSFTSIILYIVLLINSILLAVASIGTTKQIGEFLQYIPQKDYANMSRVILFLFLISTLRIITGSLLFYLERYFSYYWRQNLSDALLEKYFDGLNYYMILQFRESSIDNPDQRIAADILSFCLSLAQCFITFTSNIILLAYFTYIIIGNGSHWSYMISIFIWPFIHIIVYRIIIVPVSRYIYKKDEGEGNFRYAHVRIREYCESIAFYKSDMLEKNHVHQRLQELVSTIKSLAFRYMPMTMYGLMSAYSPQILIYSSIAYLVIYEIGPFSHLHPSKVGTVVFELYQYAVDFNGKISETFQLAEPLTLVVGNGTRIAHMIEMCDHVKKQKEKEMGKLIEDNACISFENVTLRTPMNTVLLHDLNLKVNHNENIIIMGPSGCGKSSILRILAGLWGLTEGTIRRPLKIGKDGILFVPQVPYLVPGSLIDQIVYPASRHEQSFGKEEAESLIKKVNLEYLLKRYSVSDSRVNWECMLSFGELQRLGFARLLYHSPKFALLDESTSALDAENENLMYSLCQEYGITFMSVAHRTSVKKFHSHVLKLDGKCCYQIERIDKSNSDGSEKDCWRQISCYHPNPDDVKLENGIGDHDDFNSALIHEDNVISHSVEISNTGRNKKDLDYTGHTGINRQFFTRLFKISTILFSGGLLPIFYFIVFLITTVLSIIAIYPLLFLGPAILQSIVSKSTNSLIVLLVIFVITMVVISGLISVSNLVKMLMGLHWRKKLTEYLHEHYFDNQMFYKILKLNNIQEKGEDVEEYEKNPIVIDNPDQRIASDVNSLTSGFESSGMVSIISSFVGGMTIMIGSVVFFTLRLGVIGPITCLIYGGFFLISQIIFADMVAKFNFQQDKLEGNFRFSLSRLKDHSEQIAFYSGKVKERNISTRHFFRVQRNRKKLIFWQSIMNLAKVSAITYTPVFSIISLTMSMFFGLVTVNVGPGMEFTRIIAELITYGATALVTISSIIVLLSDVSNNIGSVGRVGQLIECFEELKHKFNVSDDAEHWRNVNDRIEFDQVSCITPKRSRVLISKLSLKIKARDSIQLLINGPSGCGKSSLLRLIAKLWPIYEGIIYTPNPITSTPSLTNNYPETSPVVMESPNQRKPVILFVPQKPYLMFGTLRQQIIYPLKECGEKNFSEVKEIDRELLEILKLVKLDYIIDRLNGWNVKKEWSTVLSQGEQQRLGFARVLYHRPLFAILDESTASLDIENEEMMYKYCLNAGIRLISVGHRDTIEKFHNQKLVIDVASTGWTLYERK